MSDRYKYRVEDVVGNLHSAALPTTINRTYHEHAALRELLKLIIPEDSFTSACELGMGFGRMTPVLTEVAHTVAGFEREPELLKIAKALMPDVQCYEVSRLGDLPALAEHFSLVLTWTVLQHLHDDEVVEAIKELNRVTTSTAFAILCEETAPTPPPSKNKQQHVCIGRSVEEYARLLGDDWRFLHSEQRPKEATQKTPNVGTIMLFKKVPK